MEDAVVFTTNYMCIYTETFGIVDVVFMHEDVSRDFYTVYLEFKKKLIKWVYINFLTRSRLPRIKLCL